MPAKNASPKTAQLNKRTPLMVNTVSAVTNGAVQVGQPNGRIA
jgi:hypothetical protein